MQSFKDHLNKELEDSSFKELFEEEKYLLELGLQIIQTRKKLSMTQKELAEKSHVTQ
ncbi:hypothetical protein FACS1894172_12950 [Spirochaetia bacterium]|nr:hypothetical protein FACS1894164_08080 [Spirochaetia bacterium]GHU33760.1 hypothetical protein FACS1894172_12950 [Spirochaetia bacterium]